MARNSEKAMTALARWRAAELGTSTPKERRPFLATECENLQEAERWRMQIIREISKKVSQIQNAGLGEFRIRDLNDEINKLLREKGHWEVRIVELGGPNYRKVGPKMLDDDGKEVPGNRGYKYFGAAKELPGVRELFEQEPPPPSRRTRGELMKEVDADYYGYRDDDDGILVPLETEEEKRAIIEAVADWKSRKSGGTDEEVEPMDEADLESLISDKPLYIAHVDVPSQEDIKEALLQKRKRELLSKYVGDLDET